MKFSSEIENFKRNFCFSRFGPFGFSLKAQEEGANDEEKAKYKGKALEDKKHARTRFFPVRAKTWMKKTRDLGVPDDFEFPTEVCVQEMVVDETGLPNPDKMSANASRFQEWCKMGSWSSCGQSETGRIRFRKVRFQTPNSVSFFGLTEFRGANSVSSSQPIICV